MDPMGSILLLLRPWMGYDYTIIQVVCWVELPEQRRLYPIFCENMDPDKWYTTAWYRVTRNPKEFRGLTGCHGTSGFGASHSPTPSYMLMPSLKTCHWCFTQ